MIPFFNNTEANFNTFYSKILQFLPSNLFVMFRITWFVVIHQKCKHRTNNNLHHSMRVLYLYELFHYLQSTNPMYFWIWVSFDFGVSREIQLFAWKCKWNYTAFSQLFLNHFPEFMWVRAEKNQNLKFHMFQEICLNEGICSNFNLFLSNLILK